MPSRWDLITGKVPQEMSNKKIEDSIKIISKEPMREEMDEESGKSSSIPIRRFLRPTFLNRLKLVNEVTGTEIRLSQSAEFNLTISATNRGAEATISLTITCPVDEAQHFLEGLRT